MLPDSENALKFIFIKISACAAIDAAIPVPLENERPLPIQKIP